jgi:hypothetical protein
MNDVTRATCRGCGATSAERGYEATLQPGWTPPVEARPPARPSRGLTLVVLILIGAGLVWKLRPARRFPTDVPLERYWVGEKRAAKDPCETRSTCVVVYMSPWCRACQHHVGSTLPQLRAKWGANRDQPALKVVLGNGDSGPLEEMARRVGDPVFLDRDDLLLQALSVHRFPSFYVVDQANRITHEGDDAIAWLNKQP